MQPTTYYDPVSGNEVDETGNELPSGGNVNEILPDTLRFSNGAFYGSDVGPRPVFIGRTGPFSVTETTSGHWEVIGETQFNRMNDATQSKIQRMVGGEATVNVPGYGPVSFDIGQARVAPTDSQWMAYPQNNGGTGYTTVKGPFANDEELRSVHGLNVRLATGEEAVYAAVMKQIISENAEILHRIAEELNIEGETGATLEYKAARLVLGALDLSQLRYYASYLFG